MDPAGLAAAVTALLTPHIAKAGEKLPEKVGEKLPEPMGKLWNAVNEKFKGRAAAEEAAKDWIAAPLEADNQAAFRKELKKLLVEAGDFVPQLLVLLQAAQAGPADQIIAEEVITIENSFGTIQFGANNVQNIGTQINDSTIGGDVTGGDKITSSE